MVVVAHLISINRKHRFIPIAYVKTVEALKKIKYSVVAKTTYTIYIVFFSLSITISLMMLNYHSKTISPN
jgi:hypothetical protein